MNLSILKYLDTIILYMGAEEERAEQVCSDLGEDLYGMLGIDIPHSRFGWHSFPMPNH